MSGLEFTAALVSALAWPLVALAGVWLLRGPLVGVLGREGLKRLKAGPVEAEWERELGRAEAHVRRRHAPPPQGLAGVVTTDLVELAAEAPTAAIEEAYDRIGVALEVILSMGGVDVIPVDVIRRAELAKGHKLITDESLRAIEGATVMRNLALRRPELTDERRALEYLPLADAIVYALANSSPKSPE